MTETADHPAAPDEEQELPPPVARPVLLALVSVRVSRPDRPVIEATALVRGDGFGHARRWQDECDRAADERGVPRVTVSTWGRTLTTADEVERLRANWTVIHEFAEPAEPDPAPARDTRVLKESELP